MADITATKTAFVLVGGGSYGAIQVGMLRELVAHGVRPDLVIAASVGALNGSYFCCDTTAAGVARLASIWCGLQRRGVFPRQALRLLRALLGTSALADPSGLRALIQQHMPNQPLEQAAIAMHAEAKNLLRGALVLLSSGPALPAILAGGTPTGA